MIVIVWQVIIATTFKFKVKILASKIFNPQIEDTPLADLHALLARLVPKKRVNQIHSCQSQPQFNIYYFLILR